MRRSIDSFVLIAVVAVGGYVAYTHQSQLREAVSAAEQRAAPCAEPLSYSVGTVDPRFGISKSTLGADLQGAEAIWEKPSGKDLFAYRQSGGAVTVSLVYDSRKAAADKLKAAGIRIDNSKATYDSLKARYDALAAQVASEQSRYDSRVAAYQRDEHAYNASVAYWNEQGGAPQAEYQRLQDEKAALEDEFSGVKPLETALNADISTLNALATALNQLIVQLNLNVEQYNRAGAAAGEFEEGLYKEENGVQTIDIYEYSDHAQLVRVSAHEMGHALGLPHVQDPGSIMYKVNRGESLKATAADIIELDRACASGIL